MSGGADVNGDGLSDFVVGAPGNNDNLTYTIYGSNFNNAVNQVGTIGNNVMVGTPTGENFLGNEGNDQIYTNGGRDVVYAGPRDDLVTVSDATFQRLDGGTGTNALKFEGYNGENWNLTALSPSIRIKNFEILDITNYGANTLTLNSLTVDAISPTGIVTVDMDSNDTLNLSSDFVYKGTVYDGSKNLYQYSSQTTKAVVLVNPTTPTPAIPSSPVDNIFTSQTPVNDSYEGSVLYELGTQFTSSQNGVISAIRYYKTSGETGNHVGRIWSSSGQLLDTVEFTNETALGWQQAQLATPLNISASTQYTVSVNSNSYYAQTVGGFDTAITNGDLTATEGTYSNTAGIFPTNVYSNSNYFRDVVFTPTSTTTAPSYNLTYNAPSLNTPQPITSTASIATPAVAAASVPSAQATTTNTNISNNLPAKITITSPTVSESDGKVSFMLTRMGGNNSDYLAVRYLTIDGGAKAGLNYDAAAGQTVFASGEINKTITIALPANQTYTGNQQFQVEAAITKKSSTPLSNWSVALNDTHGSAIRQWTYDLIPTVPLPVDRVNPLTDTTGQFDFYATANSNGKSNITFTVTGAPKANGIYVQNAQGQWIDFVFNGTTGAEVTKNTDGTKTVTLHLQDGGRGDFDGSLNGVIGVKLAVTDSPLTTLVGTPLRDSLRGTSRGNGTQIFGLGGGDTLTGHLGRINEFTYTSPAETGSTITNFKPGRDVIKLTEVLQSLGYEGTDAIGDHYVGFKGPSTGTFVTLDKDGSGIHDIPRNFIFVKGLTSAQLDHASNFVF